MKKPLVSVVILDFLKSQRVLESVASLHRQVGAFRLEIIVADNSCNPANAAKLRQLETDPTVRLIFHPRNLGYTGGVNAAARHATGEFLLILNPDIVWRQPDALQLLVSFLQANPAVGIVGPRQIDEPTGAVAITARQFPRLWLQIVRRTFLRRLPFLRAAVAADELPAVHAAATPQPVDWLQSSCLLIRRNLWQQLGGLDERYFLFMSDPALAYAAWQLDLSSVYLPAATVQADGLRCSAGGVLTFFRKWTLRQHLLDAVRYAWLHRGRPAPRQSI